MLFESKVEKREDGYVEVRKYEYNPGYVNNLNKWKVVYRLEYIDDKKTWENLEKWRNPWEAYKKIEFDNLSNAITLYALWQIQDNIYDCRLWMTMTSSNGEWYEEYIEFESTYRWGVKERINREMNRRIDAAEKRNIELAKQNTKMAEFLKKYGVDPYKVVNEEVS